MNADIQSYIQTMPQHRELLNLLQSILQFQTNLAEKTQTDNVRIEPSVARARWQAGQPLFTGESPALPTSLFREALADLRPLLPPGEKEQIALDRLLDSPLNLEALLNGLLTDSETQIQRVADTTCTDPDTITFLFRAVLSPVFEKQAAPYQDLAKMAAWRRGICPVCGSEPAIARLAHDNGQRLLACSLCRTEWPFDRLRCPFCEGDGQYLNISGKTRPYLRHFALDGDEVHRVDCCDQCQRYIKTVDERVVGRPVNLLVEDVITAHLDVLARDAGYT